MHKNNSLSNLVITSCVSNTYSLLEAMESGPKTAGLFCVAWLTVYRSLSGQKINCHRCTLPQLVHVSGLVHIGNLTGIVPICWLKTTNSIFRLQAAESDDFNSFNKNFLKPLTEIPFNKDWRLSCAIVLVVKRHMLGEQGKMYQLEMRFDLTFLDWASFKVLWVGIFLGNTTS